VVGWFLLNAHRVPMMTVEPGARGVTTTDVSLVFASLGAFVGTSVEIPRSPSSAR
jgi:hypothetical protein